MKTNKIKRFLEIRKLIEGNKIFFKHLAEARDQNLIIGFDLASSKGYSVTQIFYKT